MISTISIHITRSFYFRIRIFLFESMMHEEIPWNDYTRIIKGNRCLWMSVMELREIFLVFLWCLNSLVRSDINLLKYREFLWSVSWSHIQYDTNLLKFCEIKWNLTSILKPQGKCIKIKSKMHHGGELFKKMRWMVYSKYCSHNTLGRLQSVYWQFIRNLEGNNIDTFYQGKMLVKGFPYTCRFVQLQARIFDIPDHSIFAERMQ